MTDDAVLMAPCPNCGQWFASAIQMDAGTWASIRMRSGLMERCSQCGKSTRYAKAEYQFGSRVNLGDPATIGP